MQLSVAIQHHPSRRDILGRLSGSLTGLDVEVVTDPEPESRIRSAWRTYRRALEQTPAWSTHRLIIQDDAVPCRSFPEVLQRAVAAKPDSLLVLCVNGIPVLNARAVQRAGAQGHSWVEYVIGQMIISTVALVWPVRLIGPTLDYIDAQNWPDSFTSDDERVAKAMRALGEQAYATVPSLVDHPDDVESVCMKKPKYRNPARLTACFVPDCCDPLTIDWT